MTITALVAACLDGDNAAWREFVDRHAPLVYSIARRSGLSETESEDMMQDVFVAAFRSLESIEDPVALPKWLIVSTTRACRRGRPRRGVSLDALVEPGQEADPEAERWETMHRLRGALDGLDERCRILLTTLFAGSKPPDYAEAADRLGFPGGASVRPASGAWRGWPRCWGVSEGLIVSARAALAMAAIGEPGCSDRPAGPIFCVRVVSRPAAGPLFARTPLPGVLTREHPPQ